MHKISARFDDLGREDADRTWHLGIMGGTFDPIHQGHLSCAERARDACGLDAVLFVPTGNPVFKLDKQVTPAHHRLAMCALAIEPNERFDVSDIEIAREGVTYTVDTLRQLKEHYPENVELHLIVGDDVLQSIAKWKDVEQVARMASLILVGRPGQQDDAVAELAAARELGFSCQRVETSALNISSSALRGWASQGRSIRYLTPKRVIDYIFDNELYGMGERADG